MILSKAINRMRSSLLTAGLLTLATAASAQGYTYKSVPNDPMQTRIYTLKNGLTVYLSVNNEKPRIQTYIAVRTGSRNDPPETTGLAHYLEHLMFKGTTHFGTSNLEAERPYLDSIEARYEYYRTLTDPAQRKACYHEQRCHLLRGEHPEQRDRQLAQGGERPFPEHGHSRFPHGAGGRL